MSNIPLTKPPFNTFSQKVIGKTDLSFGECGIKWNSE